MFLSVIIIVLGVFVGCIHECGDIWDRSPNQLINENDFIVLAELNGVDTLLKIGRFDYFGSQSEYFLIEYSFLALNSFKVSDSVIAFNLWNCERRDDDGFQTGFRFDLGETTLIYGNRIMEVDSLFLAMASMAPVQVLSKILNNETDEFSWFARETDSSVALALINSEQLKTKFINMTQNDELIYYCPEEYILTSEDFWYGTLCYYDSTGRAQSVSSSEYLKQLKKLTGGFK